MFLHPSAKRTQIINLTAALHTTLCTHYQPQLLSTHVPALRTLNDLRLSTRDPPTTEQSLKALLKYHRSLSFYLTDCNLPSNLPQASPLLWTSSANADQFSQIPDLQFDKLCTSFNLGVNECILAMHSFQLPRSDDSHGLKASIKKFQHAAGYFERCEQTPTPGGVDDVTPDIHPSILSALKNAMLGNAQQVIFKLCKENGKSISNLSKLAKGTADFYKLAYNSCTSVGDSNTMKFIGLSEVGKAGTEICCLKKAKKELLKCVEEMKTMPANPYDREMKEEMETELEKLKRNIEKRLQSAEEDNRTIYREEVPESIPDVLSGQIAKTANVTTVIATAVVESSVFSLQELPQYDSVEKDFRCQAAERYTRAADGLVDDITLNLNTSVTNMTHSLTTVYPAILQEAQTSIASSTSSTTSRKVAKALTEIEQRAVDSVRYVQHCGGTKSMMEIQTQVEKLSSNLKNDIEHLNNLLKDEEAQDEKIRQFFPGARANSMQLTAGYRSKLGRINANMEQASNADRVVAHEAHNNQRSVDEIMDVDVDMAVAIRLQKQENESNDDVGNRQAIVNGIMTKVDSDVKIRVDKSIERKKELLANLRNARQRDDAVSATLEISEPHDQESEIEQMTLILTKTYKPYQDESVILTEDMEAITNEMNSLIISELKSIHEKHHTYGNDHAKLEADSANSILNVFQHEAAAVKFAETLEHLQQGMMFYAREGDTLRSLKNDVSSFVAARHDQATQMMNSGNVGGPPPPPQGGSYYPGGPGVGGGSSGYSSGQNVGGPPPPPQGGSYYPGGPGVGGGSSGYSSGHWNH